EAEARLAEGPGLERLLPNQRLHLGRRSAPSRVRRFQPEHVRETELEQALEEGAVPRADVERACAVGEARQQSRGDLLVRPRGEARLARRVEGSVAVLAHQRVGGWPRVRVDEAAARAGDEAPVHQL